MSKALSQITTLRTSQKEQAHPSQKKNAAGGYTFVASDRARIERFLVIGTEGGAYYTTEAKLTADNAQLVIAAAETDGIWLVQKIVEISTAGRAPKQSPGLFALAVATASSDLATRQAAFAALPAVARTATSLYEFIGYMMNFRGWGAAATKGVSRWLTEKDADKLAYQMVKYRSRKVDGAQPWNMSRVLRLAKPVVDGAHSDLFRWATAGEIREGIPSLVTAFTEIQSATPKRAIEIIAEHPISWEMLPDTLKTNKDVMCVLVEKGMPQNALIRNLPRLTNLGVLTGDTLRHVVAQLEDIEKVRRARIHPINTMVAMKTYALGHSSVSDNTWQPIRQIIDALDSTFYASYGTIEPSGKRILMALDVSGSMRSHKAASQTNKRNRFGNPELNETAVDCREVAGALALVMMNTENQVDVVGFTTGKRSTARYGYANPALGADGITPLTLSPRQRLDDACRYMDGLEFGGTDCAAPALWAARENRDYDTIIIVTDNETWQGDVHPHQALRTYRNKVGHSVRQIVVACTPTESTIGDPKDTDSLDVCGFDSNVPNLITDFSARRI